MDIRHSLGKKEIKKLFLACRAILRKASGHILARMGKDHQSSYKKDGTIVTAIDVEVEKILKNFVSKNFPDHGFLGEETKWVDPKSGFCWHVDPIDGTHNFAHGIPTFGCMASVAYQGMPLVGVIRHPVLGLEYAAAFGMGAFCNGKRIKIKDAPFSRQDIIALHQRTNFELSGLARIFDTISASHDHIRIYFDALAITSVVHGKAAAVIEGNASVWEMPTYEILIEEAGGLCHRIPLPRGVKDRKRIPHILGRPAVVKHLVKWLRV